MWPLRCAARCLRRVFVTICAVSRHICGHERATVGISFLRNESAGIVGLTVEHICG
jgi:hypothetical protein